MDSRVNHSAGNAAYSPTNPAPVDPKVIEIINLYRWAYSEFIKHFARMERLQASFDNQINPDEWPTLSQIPIPMAFISVEQALPFAMDFLFPNNRFIELIPKTPGVSWETRRSVEDLVEATLLETMKIRRRSF